MNSFVSDLYYSSPEMKLEVNSVKVQVCGSRHNVSSTGCKLCGSITKTPFASWDTVFCESGGIEGEALKVNFTLFMPCELEVYGIQLQ